MPKFEECLVRLKHALEVASDKEVADMLGMTQKAFTARKSRDSFPVDKLLALSAQRPELMLDVDYIVTGEYKSVKQAKELVRRYQVSEDAAEKRIYMVRLNKHEHELVSDYRAATETAQRALELIAKSLEKKGGKE